MLKIKEKARQALGLFSRAILFYDARHNSRACVLAKLVEDHAHALQDTSPVHKQRFWSDDNVLLGKCLTNGIQRYAQPGGIHYPGSGGQSAHPWNLPAAGNWAGVIRRLIHRDHSHAYTTQGGRETISPNTDSACLENRS